MTVPENLQKWFETRRRRVYGSPEHKWEAYYKLKRGDTFMEAGAYWCRYGRIASNKVGSNGRVLLVEPDPFNIEVIRKVVEEKKLGNVTLIEKAVWNETAELSFSTRGNLSGHRVVKVKDSSIPKWRARKPLEQDDVIGVEADTVDNILEKHDVSQVDLFAADVENSEIPMLQGMTKSLGNKVIKHLAIAAYHRHPDGNYEEVTEILREYGYRCVRGENSLRGVVYGCL